MRARKEEIIKEIKRVRGSYGQKNAGTPKSILFTIIKKLFNKVKEWARHEHIINVFKRVKTAAKRIKEATEKLRKQERVIRGNVIYA
jgi:capsule polysaccharide export protein KpsE/RkpR